MRIGIIAEGPSDVAVIQNILKGATGLDSNDFVPIVPQLDNTSKAITNSSWTVVQKECNEKKNINQFLAISDNTHLVIHLDAAEAQLYGIDLPDIKDDNYCLVLRERIIQKIIEWLGGEHQDITLFAIAIQEIDAWVLTIYDHMNSCKIINVKKKFSHEISKKYQYGAGHQLYSAYSDDFRNAKKTQKGKYLDYNCSLKAFWNDAEEMFNSTSTN